MLCYYLLITTSYLLITYLQISNYLPITNY